MHAGLIAPDRATMAASGAAGAVVGRLSDPNGTGSTFATYGTVPGQLALSSGRIVKGSGAAVAGETYTIGIVATSADGRSSLRMPIAVTAV